MGFGESIRFKWRTRLRGTFGLALCLTIVACSGTTYSGPEWTARVVDMESGAPIEGAIVVARWQLERYSGRFAGWLFVAEAVTDKDGFFRFPAWGPLGASPDSGMRTRMSPNMPKPAIFKPLFRVETDDCCSDSSYLNEYWNYGRGEAIRPSWANGKTFALIRFQGSIDAYREHLENNFSLAGPPCAFLDMPRTYAVAVMESRRLDFVTGRGIPHLSLEDLQEHRNSANCPKSIFSAIERYLR